MPARRAGISKNRKGGSYFCFVSVLISVLSEVFFLPTFLVRFFLVVVFLPPTFDSIFVSVLCVCVPVTGFVVALDSVDLDSDFFSFVCAVWAKTPTGKARTTARAIQRARVFFMGSSFRSVAECTASDRRLATPG